MLTFLIVFFTLLALIILHELGHFILAKRFGVDVEEFGIGYPPRIFGKKIGSTLYSFNLIPFGAFVKVRGETGGIEDYRSFLGKPMWQRVLIVLGGVLSFWIISAFLLSVLSFVWGIPVAVSDKTENILSPRVKIIEVLPNSLAQKTGLKAGDVILKIKAEREEVEISKMKQVKEFFKNHKGEKVLLTIKRGKEKKELEIKIPEHFREKDGLIGVLLIRVGLKKSPFYLAPFEGTKICLKLTKNMIEGWILGIEKLLKIRELPRGVKMELLGPIGIFSLLKEYFEMGINYFLFLVAVVSVGLALANILPIPALDGGKLLFLGIEMIRKKPVSQKFEQKITAFFFVLLIILMIFITIKFDIPRIL